MKIDKRTKEYRQILQNAKSWVRNWKNRMSEPTERTDTSDDKLIKELTLSAWYDHRAVLELLGEDKLIEDLEKTLHYTWKRLQEES